MSRSAVITGAAGGLGRAIAERLAADGFGLLLTDASPSVEEAADALGARWIRADLTREDGIAAVSAAAGRTVDCLVNNAGLNRDARAAKLTDEDFTTVVRVDLIAPARLALALRPALAGGSVVNISSRAALGNFGQANYVAAKSGLIGLTRALAVRWAPDVRVNAVAPGLIATPMTSGMPAELLERMVDRIPIGRIGVPEDVACTVSHLASPDASYLTGQVLFVCGGRSVAV